MPFSFSVVGRLTPGLTHRLRSGMEDHLTTELHAFARRAGWPNEAVRHLSVRHGDDGFRVHVHPDGQDIVDDLEYGNRERPPLGTLRQFEGRISTFSDGKSFEHLMMERNVEV